MGKQFPKNSKTRLQALRAERHLTQAEVARFLKMDIKTYRNHEKDPGYLPSTPVAVALADFFGVSVDYILGRDDPETGLSSEAIRQLRIWQQKCPHLIGVLNDLLSYDLKCQQSGKAAGHMATAIFQIGHIIQPNPERKTRISEHILELNHQLQTIQEDTNPENQFFTFYFPALETLSEAPAKEQDPGIRRVRDPKLAAAVLRSEETPGE